MVGEWWNLWWELFSKSIKKTPLGGNQEVFETLI